MASNEVSIATYAPAVTYARVIDVIKMVSEGSTLQQACDALYVSRAQVKAACKREPELAKLMDEAEEIRDDILADMLVDETKLPTDSKMAAVISSNARFLLERRRPAKYGKALEKDTEGEQSKLLAEALRAAVERIPKPVALPEPAPRAIEATFTVVEPKKEAAVVTPPPVSREETPEGVMIGTPDGLEELRRLGLI